MFRILPVRQLFPHERILTWWIKDCDWGLSYSSDGTFTTRENSDLMNKGLRHQHLARYGRGIQESARENSDLMNKGLRLNFCCQWQLYLLTWENSDLMNKGLRPVVREVLFTSRKGCRENSDLMNKGLRRYLLPLLTTALLWERILTWWIKDCDSYNSQASDATSCDERILTWWIKDCDHRHLWHRQVQVSQERILTWWIKDCDLSLVWKQGLSG